MEKRRAVRERVVEALLIARDLWLVSIMFVLGVLHQERTPIESVKNRRVVRSMENAG
jgi:hypothetical protein